MILASAGAGQTAPADLSDPVIVFAGCAGRYSAEMEHSWLIGTNADAVTRKRATMVELVDTVLTGDRGREVLARRIEAKMAQATLLQRAAFNTDAEDAARASWLARRALSRCEALIGG